MFKNIEISMIAAMTPGNNVIGKDNDLPWRLPADLKYFKEKTLNKTVIMGRLTYESIGKPLPDRFNIVISSLKGYSPKGVAVVNSPGVAIDLAKARGEKEVFVIGGSKIYGQYMAFADYLYITFVMGWYEGDKHFPAMNPEKWQIISVQNYNADEKNECDYAFCVFKRKNM